MMAKDMPNHSGPVVNERACLANKGEVSGVRDAVVVWLPRDISTWCIASREAACSPWFENFP